MESRANADSASESASANSGDEGKTKVMNSNEGESSQNDRVSAESFHFIKNPEHHLIVCFVFSRTSERSSEKCHFRN